MRSHLAVHAESCNPCCDSVLSRVRQKRLTLRYTSCRRRPGLSCTLGQTSTRYLVVSCGTKAETVGMEDAVNHSLSRSADTPCAGGTAAFSL